MIVDVIIVDGRDAGTIARLLRAVPRPLVT